MVCRICAHAEAPKIFAARDMMFGSGKRFQYFQCLQCGCLQIVDIPADLSKYYPDDYYSYSVSPWKQADRSMRGFLRRWRDRYAVSGKGVMGRFFFQKFPNEALQSLAGVPNLTLATKILDVGCGSGSLLNMLSALGFKNLAGSDPYLQHDIDSDGRVKIWRKNLDEICGEWELIMFHHVFEHLADPIAVLQAVAPRLAKTGLCLIRLPIVPCYAWGHYGVDWIQFDAPRHLFMHSIPSLKIAAGHAGLQVEKIIYDSTAYQFWGSEQNRRNIPVFSERSYKINPARSIFSAREIAEFKKRAQQLNAEGRGDSAAFYLSKQS